ncbi:MAG TPA: hypothetical protein DCZ76_11285 [Treponema sp.]|nr:hypothetical protein [Treponema sp.]
MQATRTNFSLSPVFCLHNGTIVLEANKPENTITFGLLDSSNEKLKERLCHAVHSNIDFAGKSCGINFRQIKKEEFNLKLSKLFEKKDNSLSTNNFYSDEEANKSKDLQEKEENEASALLSGLIFSAQHQGATDIHIEAEEVRFRIKGLLTKYASLEHKSRESLVQRIKLLAKMNVVENRRGQDGQFTFMANNNENIFIRVSCLPSVGASGESESVVLRILDSSKTPLSLEKLGYDQEQIEELKELCRLQNGLVLICGPTGSGKSTTAGAILEEIRKSQCDTKKIISLEDPPEYVLPGVTQVKVQPGHDMDFADALRRVFRQDPDVIFIGEIRDSLTAKVALQAALTGHLVFATLHTGSISQAKLRLINLGESSSLVEEVIKGIISQRLVNGKLEAEIEVSNGK